MRGCLRPVMGSQGVRLLRGGWRLTQRGAVALPVVAATAFAACWTGNNALCVVAAVEITVGMFVAWTGGRELEGVRVGRTLPTVAVAGRPARGAVEVSGVDAPVVVEELDGSTVVALDAAGAQPATWWWSRRGRAALRGVRVSTTAPLGLVERWVELEVLDEVLVWPEPEGGGEFAVGVAARGPAREEVVGMRAWAPGDAWRDVHPLLSARAGVPIVRVWAGMSEEPPVIVEVPAGTGRAWEASIGRAAGEILAAAREGRSVGLRAPGVWMPPRVGEIGVRALLDALALLPSGGA